MARTVRDTALGSREARRKLARRGKPYYRQIDPGLHLGYRKGKGGGKWVVRWYVGDQQYRVETLDGIADDVSDPDGERILDFAQAQAAARAFHSSAVALPSSGLITVAAAIDAYIAFLMAERRTGHDAEVRLGKWVSAELGAKTVAEVLANDIEKFKRGMVQQDADDPEVERRSKDSANRVLSMLKAALNRAFYDESNRIPTDTAWRRVKPFRMAGRARQVHLDRAQSKRLVNTCSGAFRDLVTAALLTGARAPGELADLHVRDLRADLRILSLRHGKTGGRDIVLTEEATRFFAKLAAGRHPDALLLLRDDGKAWGKNHHTRPMQEAVTTAKLPADTTIYALRHTYASQALLAGMNLKLLAENMGTSIRMLELHYAKFIAQSRREMIEATAPKLGLLENT